MQPAKSYAQVSKQNISTSEVIKIKEAFSSINAKKINQINNIVKSTPKAKPHIQMTTKGPSRKHVIIPMSNDNIIKFMKNLLTHIVNINRTLRNSKSEILVDFICSNPLGIMVVTNKVSLQSDLQIIEHYVKNSNDINTLQVEVPHLPQSKLYLKIIGIPFFLHGNFQDWLTSDNVKTIIKQNQIFNNITLAFKLWVIKVSLKSNMSIVWFDIWDVQSNSRAKSLINCFFNIGRYIPTIRNANINSRVPQCKNCWKWDHSTFLCRIQGSKCVKCNRPYKSENHCEFRWCYKNNKKTNSLCLETKKGKSCPYIFKCSNCQDDHQADSNQRPFWRHKFNREWHQKKYVEIHENRIKLIHSVRNENLHQ